MSAHPPLEPLPFSLSAYEARRAEVLLHMSHFFLRYLNDLYRAFDGDLAMVIVLGEISHHNTTHLFSPDRLDNESARRLREEGEKPWKGMPECNALSLSMATGIPRETVRRKVAALLERGWITKVGRNGLRLTPACADHFGPNFSIRILSQLLRAARSIEHLLAAGDTDEPVRPRAAAGRVGKASPKPTKS